MKIDREKEEILELCKKVVEYKGEVLGATERYDCEDIECINCPFSCYNNPDGKICGDDCDEYYLRKAEEYLTENGEIGDEDNFWRKLIDGYIIVNCKTLDEAKDFLNRCEDRNIVWGSGDLATAFTRFENHYEDTCYGCSLGRLVYGVAEDWKDDDIEAVVVWEKPYAVEQIVEEKPEEVLEEKPEEVLEEKPEEVLERKPQKKGYTLTEVIPIVLETGDSYECEYDIIHRRSKNTITIEDKEEERKEFILNTGILYTKVVKHKEVDFAEAFKSYRKEKIKIKSLVSGKIYDPKFAYSFNEDDIEGKWYILKED